MQSAIAQIGEQEVRVALELGGKLGQPLLQAGGRQHQPVARHAHVEALRGARHWLAAHLGMHDELLHLAAGFGVAVSECVCLHIRPCTVRGLLRKDMFRGAAARWPAASLASAARWCTLSAYAPP